MVMRLIGMKAAMIDTGSSRSVEYLLNDRSAVRSSHGSGYSQRLTVRRELSLDRIDDMLSTEEGDCREFRAADHFPRADPSVVGQDTRSGARPSHVDKFG